MKRILDLRESTLAAIRHESACVVLLLDPARIVDVRSDMPARDGNAQWRVVALRCSSPAPILVLHRLPARITAANLLIGGSRRRQPIELPLVVGAPTILRITTEFDERLTVSASGIAAVFPREHNISAADAVTFNRRDQT